MFSSQQLHGDVELNPGPKLRHNAAGDSKDFVFTEKKSNKQYGASLIDNFVIMSSFIITIVIIGNTQAASEHS